MWVFGIVAVVSLSAFWFFIEHTRRPEPLPSPHRPSINRFILLSQEGGHEKEWHVSGEIAFLIGKSTADKEADIDLGDTQFSEYISNEHAVINYSEGCWYIEDIGSLNGVGLRKKSEEHIFRLRACVPYRVDIGDVIYISKAKLLLL